MEQLTQFVSKSFEEGGSSAEGWGAASSRSSVSPLVDPEDSRSEPPSSPVAVRNTPSTPPPQSSTPSVKMRVRTSIKPLPPLPFNRRRPSVKKFAPFASPSRPLDYQAEEDLEREKEDCDIGTPACLSPLSASESSIDSPKLIIALDEDTEYQTEIKMEPSSNLYSTEASTSQSNNSTNHSRPVKKRKYPVDNSKEEKKCTSPKRQSKTVTKIHKNNDQSLPDSPQPYASINHLSKVFKSLSREAYLEKAGPTAPLRLKRQPAQQTDAGWRISMPSQNIAPRVQPIAPALPRVVLTVVRPTNNVENEAGPSRLSSDENKTYKSGMNKSKKLKTCETGSNAERNGNAIAKILKSKVKQPDSPIVDTVKETPKKMNKTNKNKKKDDDPSYSASNKTIKLKRPVGRPRLNEKNKFTDKPKNMDKTRPVDQSESMLKIKPSDKRTHIKKLQLDETKPGKLLPILDEVIIKQETADDFVFPKFTPTYPSTELPQGFEREIVSSIKASDEIDQDSTNFKTPSSSYGPKKSNVVDLIAARNLLSILTGEPNTNHIHEVNTDVSNPVLRESSITTPIVEHRRDSSFLTLHYIKRPPRPKVPRRHNAINVDIPSSSSTPAKVISSTDKVESTTEALPTVSLTPEQKPSEMIPKSIPDNAGMARSLNDMIDETPLKNQSPTIKINALHNSDCQMSLPCLPISNDSNLIFSQKNISHKHQTILTQSHQTMIVIPSDHSTQSNIQPKNFRIIPENRNPRMILPTPPNGNAIKQGHQNQRVIRPANGNENGLCIQNHSAAQQNLKFIQPGHKNQQLTVLAHPSGSLIQPSYDNRWVPVRNNEIEICREPENKRVTVSAQINGRDSQLVRDNHRLIVPAHTNGKEIQPRNENQRVILSANPNITEIRPGNPNENRMVIVASHPEPVNHRIILATHPNGRESQKLIVTAHTNGMDNLPRQGNQSLIAATPPNGRNKQPGHPNHRMINPVHLSEKAIRSGQPNLRMTSPAFVNENGVQNHWTAVPGNHSERPIQLVQLNHNATQPTCSEKVHQPGHPNLRMTVHNNERAPQVRTQNNIPAPPNERANDIGHPNLRTVPPAIQSISESVSRELLAIHHHLDVMEVKLPYYEEIALYLGYQKERLKLSQFYSQVEKQRKKDSQTDRNGTGNNPSSTNNQMHSVVHRQKETHSECHPIIPNGTPMPSQHQYTVAPSSSSQIKTEAQFVYEKARTPQPLSQIALPLPPLQPSYSLHKHNNSEPHRSQMPRNAHTNLPPQPHQNFALQNYSSIPQQQNMDNQNKGDPIYRLIEMDVPSMRGVPAQRTRGRKVYPRGTRGGRGRPSRSTNSVGSPDFQQISESLNRLTHLHKYFQTSFNPSVNQMPNPIPSSPLNDPISSEPNEPNPLRRLSQELQNLNTPATSIKQEPIENYTQLPYCCYSNPQHSPISINSNSPEPQDLTVPEPPAPDSNQFPTMEPTQGELRYSHEVLQQNPIALVVHGRSGFDSESTRFQDEVAEIRAFRDSTRNDTDTVMDPR